MDGVVLPAVEADPSLPAVNQLNTTREPERAAPI